MPDTPTFDLDQSGRTVLVTGSGRGLGRAIADAFAARGAYVLAADVLAAPTKTNLPSRVDGQIVNVAIDVRDEDSILNLFQQLSRTGSSIDVLVNNAGVMYKAPVDEIDLEQWQRIIDVNVTGAMLCAKHAVPMMKTRGRGRIINISSMTADIGFETYSPYSAGKAALTNLAKVWAAELAGWGITANAICPGWLDTPMAADALTAHLAAIHDESIDQARERLLSYIPQRRLIAPEEVAFTALFLASDLAAGITGESIRIDTGLAATFPAGLHRPTTATKVK
ncbi:SDR family NAD(P)-dependent oxidoreductase [Mycobacterium sp. NPDC003323]